MKLNNLPKIITSYAERPDDNSVIRIKDLSLYNPKYKDKIDYFISPFLSERVSPDGNVKKFFFNQPTDIVLASLQDYLTSQGIKREHDNLKDSPYSQFEQHGLYFLLGGAIIINFANNTSLTETSTFTNYWQNYEDNLVCDEDCSIIASSGYLGLGTVYFSYDFHNKTMYNKSDHLIKYKKIDGNSTVREEFSVNEMFVVFNPWRVNYDLYYLNDDDSTISIDNDGNALKYSLSSYFPDRDRDSENYSDGNLELLQQPKYIDPLTISPLKYSDKIEISNPSNNDIFIVSIKPKTPEI
jgi:hypothetical protein